MTDATPKPVAACAVCRTTEGSKRSNGQYVRYRGERFGLPGEVCSSCRARLKRHQSAIAAGYEPGVVGRRPKPKRTVVREATVGVIPTVADDIRITPEEVAENLQAVREQAERAGRRPRVGLTEVEIRQQHAAIRAAADRRIVAEARCQAMGWHWSQRRGRVAVSPAGC